MSRVIKFRAYVCNSNAIGMTGSFDIQDIANRRCLYTNSEDESFIYADDEDAIIMQFTGLTDKNGVEIYEGDILEFDEPEWGGKFIPEVVDFKRLIGTWGMSGDLSDLGEHRKVIGNIYENPELKYGAES